MQKERKLKIRKPTRKLVKRMHQQSFALDAASVYSSALIFGVGAGFKRASAIYMELPVLLSPFLCIHLRVVRYIRNYVRIYIYIARTRRLCPAL